MSWSDTDESRTTIQRWEAAVLSSGWTCSGWVISCRFMAQRREPAVRSERERERLTITILSEPWRHGGPWQSVHVCWSHQVSLGPGTTHKDNLSLSPAYFGQILNHHVVSLTCLCLAHIWWISLDPKSRTEFKILRPNATRCSQTAFLWLFRYYTVWWKAELPARLLWNQRPVWIQVISSLGLDQVTLNPSLVMLLLGRLLHSPLFQSGVCTPLWLNH